MTSAELLETAALWSLYDAIPHVVWVLDREGHAEFLNRAGRQLLAGAATSAADVAWTRSIHPEDAWDLQHEWSPRRTSQQSFERSIRLRLAGGEYQPFHLHAAISNGAWVLTCSPASSPAEANEPEATKGTRRFRSLIDALSESVWITDQNGEVVYDISRLPEFPAPHQPATTFTEWLARVHPEDRARVNRAWRDTIQAGTPLTIEYRLLAPDSSVRHVAMRAVPMHNRCGELEEWVGIVLDLTAGRVAEMELRRSERRYRMLGNAFAELVWTTDAEGTPASFIGGESFVEPGSLLSVAGWALLIHPEDRDRALAEFGSSIKSGLPLDSRFRLKRRNGGYCHVVSRGLPVRDEQGRIEEWIGAVVDVTAEREATLALERTVCELELSRHRARQDHALLETLIEAAPIGIAFVDTQLRLLNANRAILEHTTPADHDSAFGLPIQDIVPKSWAGIGNMLEQVLETGRPMLNAPITTINRAEDRAEYRLMSLYPVRSRGRMIGVGIVVLDVTSQKHAEQALERERYFLDLILQSVDDGILVCNQHGTLTKVNRSSLGFHGMSVPPLVPYRDWPTHYHLYHPDGETRLTLEEMPLYRAWRGETIAGTEIMIRPPGMPARLMLIRGRPLTGPSGEHYGAVVVTQDITEKRELESRLRHAQKLDAVGQLAGGVAHDFNNLLTVVAGASELLLDRLEAGTEAHRLVQEIAHAGERATGLTRQLLAFGRRSVVSPEVVQLNNLVSETERMLRRLLGEHVKMVTRLGEGLPPIRVDATQIAQVLVNLAVNARDAMPQAGILRLETEARTIDDPASVAPDLAAGRYAVLTVSDNGEGMSEETCRRLFEPFFTTKAPGKGTGLGLSTVYGIVKQAGGQITVESVLGSGTTFQILLPAADGDTVEKSAVVTEDGRARGHETILLVEDEPCVRALAREALVSHGYSVIEARDPAEALTLASVLGSALDLLVTDVVMPGMGGLELSREIASGRTSLKVLFVSGYTDDAIVRHGIMTAEVDFLQKPFGAAALARKVREVLDRAT